MDCVGVVCMDLCVWLCVWIVCFSAVGVGVYVYGLVCVCDVVCVFSIYKRHRDGKPVSIFLSSRHDPGVCVRCLTRACLR